MVLQPSLPRRLLLQPLEVVLHCASTVRRYLHVSSLNQPNSTNQPADVTYDGKVDITDVATVAKAFGSIFGPPISVRWIQKGDINNDRKIDINDVAYGAKQFGKKATPRNKENGLRKDYWCTVIPLVRTMAAGSNANSSLRQSIGGTGPIHIRVVRELYNFPVNSALSEGPQSQQQQTVCSLHQQTTCVIHKAVRQRLKDQQR